METICIDEKAWEMLKQHLNRLTSEVKIMKNRFHHKARDRWLDSHDVCSVLGLSKRTLQSYRAHGKIPFTMLGGKVYFRESDINNILKRGAKS